MDNDNLLKIFLSGAKQNLNNDMPKWLVIGNESSDLNSVVCSLVYGYYKQSKMHDKCCVIPVISIRKKNIVSRRDVIAWLNHFNIDITTELVYLEEIILLMNQFTFYRDLNITLVDHHKPLKSVFNEFVKEVIDHHEISFEYFTNQLEIKNIQLVGSCCTLLAAYILADENVLFKNVLLKLLYGVILVDTDCLSPTNGKTTQSDIEASIEIENILALTQENRMEIYTTLRNAKSDISGLTFIQQMQRDIKFIEVSWKNSNLKVAIPTVIETDVEDILSLDCMKDLLQETLIELDSNILIILTCGRNSIRRQGYLLFIENSELKDKISQFLMYESQLKLEQINVDIQLNVVVFVEKKQKYETTRKIFIHLLEKFFSQESTIKYKYQSNNCNIHLHFDEINTNSDEEEILQEGAPYTLSTPRCSCSGSPDSRNSDMNLPSLNNRRTLALIDQKRQKHNADIEVIEDENEDNNKPSGDDESPLAYTPENSDEEDNDLDSLLNNKLTFEEVKSKAKTFSNDVKEISLKISENNISLTAQKSTPENRGNKFSEHQRIDNWNKKLDSLSSEVDKKRQKLETSHFHSIVNAIVTDIISKSENIIKTENLYKKILSNWSDSYSEEEKREFIKNIENDDTLNLVNLLTAGIIRDCVSDFESISINLNEEGNDTANAKDIDDNQVQSPIKEFVESEEENSDEFIPDFTIPDLEINYSNCPVGTIINKDNQGVSNCGNSSDFDVENSSFNLYRRISSNQLDFTEDEKKLFTNAGNWYPDEDVIYSDCEQVVDNETEIDVSKKIIYPSKEITMNLAKP